MNISYNVVLPEKRGAKQSDEVNAIITFLGSKYRNMCFDYDSVVQAKSKITTIKGYQKRNDHKHYEIFRIENKVYVSKIKEGKK